jgi:hypothetical protein
MLTSVTYERFCYNYTRSPDSRFSFTDFSNTRKLTVMMWERTSLADVVAKGGVTSNRPSHVLAWNLCLVLWWELINYLMLCVCWQILTYFFKLQYSLDVRDCKPSRTSKFIRNIKRSFRSKKLHNTCVCWQITCFFKLQYRLDVRYCKPSRTSKFVRNVKHSFRSKKLHNTCVCWQILTCFFETTVVSMFVIVNRHEHRNLFAT